MEENTVADPDDVSLSRVACVSNLIQAHGGLGKILKDQPTFGTRGGSAIVRMATGNKLARAKLGNPPATAVVEVTQPRAAGAEPGPVRTHSIFPKFRLTWTAIGQTGHTNFK